MKKWIIVLSISLFMISAISAIGGLIGIIFKSCFWGWFGVIFLIQVILGYLWNIYLDRKMAVEILNFQTKLNDITTRQSIILNCAYCNFKNKVNIVLNKDNTFVCGNCQEKNKIGIAFTTIRTTEVVEVDNVIKELFKKTTEKPNNITPQSIKQTDTNEPIKITP